MEDGGLIIFPIVPINKIDLRKHPNQQGSSQKKKPKILFKDTLDREFPAGLGSKISVRI